jgi:hypothetical protein
MGRIHGIGVWLDAAAQTASVFGFIGRQKTDQEGVGVGIHQGHLAFVSARGPQDHRGQVGKAHGQRVADAVDHDGCVAASGSALDAAGCILAAEDSAKTIARKFSDGCRGRARRQWPSHLLRDVAGQHRRQHIALPLSLKPFHRLGVISVKKT